MVLFNRHPTRMPGLVAAFAH